MKQLYFGCAFFMWNCCISSTIKYVLFKKNNQEESLDKTHPNKKVIILKLKFSKSNTLQVLQITTNADNEIDCDRKPKKRAN